MLGEEELARLMAEAADSFEVPEPSFERPEVVRREPLWQRPWVQTVASVAAVAVLLAGVGTMISKSGGGRSDDMASNVNAPGSAELPTDSGGFSGGTSGGLAPTAPDVSSGKDGLQRVPSSAGAVGGAATVARSDARVVKTGEIRLRVDEGKVATTVSRVQSIVTSLQGFVADSRSQEAAEHPSAELTVRVPVARYEQLVDRVRGLGAKVVSQTASGKDVTATYADTQAQVQSLKAARERYLAILARAKTIGETLTVQQRVDEVQGQIDRLEGQRRVLADQSDYGTLTIGVSEEGDDVELQSEPSGWSKAWDDATDGFTGGLQGILGASGRALLLLLCAAVLVALGRVGWRVVRRRML
jgi:hypothetical protein